MKKKVWKTEESGQPQVVTFFLAEEKDEEKVWQAQKKTWAKKVFFMSFRSFFLLYFYSVAIADLGKILLIVYWKIKSKFFVNLQYKIQYIYIHLLWK